MTPTTSILDGGAVLVIAVGSSLLMSLLALACSIWCLLSTGTGSNNSRFRIMEEELSKLWDALQSEVRRQSVRQARGVKSVAPTPTEEPDREMLVRQFDAMKQAGRI